MSDPYDVVIVGAGSAGCVLAARLSENPARRVLLLEAGPDYPDRASLPADIASAMRPTYSHDWGWVSAPGTLGRSMKLPRGKIVGGCSAMNAAVALRGSPSDYDHWAGLGNDGWGWNDVLPVFRRLENDLDCHGPLHGDQGHVPIRRYADPELTTANRWFLESAVAMGHPLVEDHNLPDVLGAGRLPMNAIDGVRQSAALGILEAARERSNLTLRAGVLTDRVLIERGRAVGLRTVEPEGTVHASQVILSAGSYASPGLLMRSGIGPAADLRRLGIAVLVDSPGVGEHLVDHPLCGLTYAAPREQVVDLPLPLFQTLLTVRRAGTSGTPELQIMPRTVLPVDSKVSPTGAMTMLFIALLQPRSQGRVRVRSADPSAPPLIDPGHFAAPEDVTPLVEGLRLARRLARTAPFLALALEEIYPGRSVGDGDAELAAALRAKLETYHHPVGTCRMGPDADRMAVVDGRGRVRGVEGLWVIDASIMPGIPSSNTHLPTTMIAERCAEAWTSSAA